MELWEAEDKEQLIECLDRATGEFRISLIELMNTGEDEKIINFWTDVTGILEDVAAEIADLPDPY